MADDSEDKRLLERLNALKPSTVQLERQRNVVLNTASPLDPLGGIVNPSALGPAATSSSKLDALSTGSLFAEDDIIAPESLLDGDAIEDLLASLDNRNDQNPEGTATPIEGITGSDERNTRELLGNAHEFIQRTSQADETNIDSTYHLISENGKENDIPDFLKDIDNSEDEFETDEEKDEADAEKYVENLLKEIAENPPPTSPTKDSGDSPTTEDVNSNEDNLSLRLAALSLPSAPNTQPGERPKRENDETPDCCCICYDTAKLKCLDCDGDQLFCVRCWWEMHMDGEGDSGHKAVKYEGS